MNLRERNAGFIRQQRCWGGWLKKSPVVPKGSIKNYAWRLFGHNQRSWIIQEATHEKLEIPECF